jgi:hypothetical protein
MNLFKTKITAVDDSKVTTVERKDNKYHWNAGLLGTGCYRHTDESKAKIKAARALQTNYKKGPMSEERLARHREMMSAKEYREKISKALTGKKRGPMSTELKKKLSDASIGKKNTGEKTKMLISQNIKEYYKSNPNARKGKRNQDSNRGKQLMTPNGLYPSRSAVANAANVDPTTIKRWIAKWPEHYYYIN